MKFEYFFFFLLFMYSYILKKYSGVHLIYTLYLVKNFYFIFKFSLQNNIINWIT